MAIVPLLAISVAIVWQRMRSSSIPKAVRGAMPSVCLLLLPLFLVWTLVLGYFGLTDRLTLFVDSIRYAASYSGNAAQNAFEGYLPGRLLPPSLRPWGAYFALASLGSAWMALRSKGPRWCVISLWMALTPVMIGLPGKFYAHYYQLWLPVLGLAIVGVMHSFTSHMRVRTRGLLWAALILPVLGLERHRFTHTPDELSVVKYGEQFVEVRAAAHALKREFPELEQTFVWGVDTGVYFYSGARPLSGPLWCDVLEKGPLVGFFEERFMSALRQYPDPIVVDNDRCAACLPNAAQSWIDSHYVDAGRLAGGRLHLYRLKD